MTIQVILGLTLVANAALFLLLFKERTALLRNVFALYVASISVWTLSLLAILIGYPQSPLVPRLAFAAAALGLTSQLWFAQLFPAERLPTRLLGYGTALVGVFFSIASFVPDALFHSVTVSAGGYIIRDNGFLSVPYALFAAVYTILPALLFFKKSRTEKDPAVRAQARYLTIGFSIFALINVCTNSLLPVFFHIYFFNTVGPVFSLALSVAVFYIIWRHEFLGIKVIIQRGLIYSILFALLVGAYFGSLPVLDSVINNIQITVAALAFTLLVIGIGVIYAVERSFERARLLAREREYAAELEKKVEERTQHIKELQEGQKRMIGDVSHALQTPLTVLKSSLEQLARDPAKMHEHASTMKLSIDNLSTFVHDLLRLSKFDTLQAAPKTRFNLSELTRNTAEYVETVCEENGITLSHDIEDGIFCFGNSKDIQELITILLSNAVRYTKIHDTPEKTIVVNLHQDHDAITLSITDSGVGIPADKLPFIFERFYRAHEGQSERGSGLGLAIAKRIAESHNGSISAQSTPNLGTTMTVSFHTQNH